MVNQDFVNAIKSNDITKAKTIFENHMIMDTSFRDVDEMIKYVQENNIDFFEPYNGEELSADFNNLSENDINKQIMLLHRNYSLERVALIKKMSLALYHGDNCIREAEPAVSSSDQNYKTESNRSNAVKIAVAIGVVIVTVIIVIAIVVSQKQVK